jgi:hypothetical protein
LDTFLTEIVVAANLPPPDDIVDPNDFLGLSDDKSPGPVEPAHAILSVEEVEAARKRARDKIDKERRAAASKQVEEEETRRLRREEGLTSGITSEDEIVWVTIDLPDWCPNVSINSTPYWHGHSYQVPRHVARTISEQIQNALRAHDLADGKSITDQFKSRRNTVMNGATGAISGLPSHVH